MSWFLSTKVSRWLPIFGITLMGAFSQAWGAALDEGYDKALTPSDSQPSPAVVFERTGALQDPDARISEDFNIPEGLERRTAFWFDIYTKFTTTQNVIHHIRYPWVVFKVVDTKPLLDAPGNRWNKSRRATTLVANEIARVEKALKKIARTKNTKKLSTFEQNILKALSAIKGSPQTVARQAIKNIRSQLGQRDFFLSGLASSARYLPLIEKDFSAHGLPTELCRLPFVESSFNVAAESKVGASGIWQIMPNTGRNYLLVNELIDERNSPLKASLAAVEIFKENFRGLKSWPLAVTAYNHGPGGIRRGLRLTNSDSLPELISKYYGGNFQFASANFYTSFLAALHAEKYSEEIFGDEIDTRALKLSAEHQVVALQKAMRIKNVMKKTGMNVDELLDYNLDLKKAVRRNATLPRGYKLIIPSHIEQRLDKNFRTGRHSFKEASL